MSAVILDCQEFLQNIIGMRGRAACITLISGSRYYDLFILPRHA